ncbi:glutamine synthetase family protein [Gloeothece verrucosa]|uniref:Glutamate--ammonia ligase n=1 Tax=Gloeothece verrucosa (strain PCC 7822) TaxID=497965 RepID=E0U9F7_GLOV7|nr:glutamine synthetase family protein [Gloeothece verrucosa]ADN12649.1 Glutamate--ammonia ligase [Gloeothece verrucosa PCC 7822]
MDKTILTTLEQAGVQFVRVLWCDNANQIRAKAFHRQRLEAYYQHGVGISAAQQSVSIMYDGPVPGSGGGPVGEIRLVPDWDTLAVLPYAPRHARVMGDMILDGQPWSLCPRSFLKRAIASLKEKGLELMAGFENEFYLLRAYQPEITPVDQTNFASTLSMDMQQAIIDQIADALAKQGIQIEQYYSESGPGQQEISHLYTQALSAANQQIIFWETARAIARQNQMIASFIPKIFANYPGSGSHLHFSLWEEGNNILPDAQGNGQLSSLARHFIAGLLEHLPALMAITAPNPNSYRRIQPQTWSGAFCCWGYDNREAAIRVPTNPEPPSPTHIEFKTFDATANPYLALGAVIVAGLDGINRSLPLVDPVAVDPGTLTDQELQEKAIQRLPSNLGEAIQQLEKDQVLLAALGADLAQAFIAVRRAEWEAMKDWSLEQQVKFLLNYY